MLLPNSFPILSTISAPMIFGKKMNGRTGGNAETESLVVKPVLRNMLANCDFGVFELTPRSSRASQTGARLPAVSLTRTGEGTRRVGPGLFDPQYSQAPSDLL